MRNFIRPLVAGLLLCCFHLQSESPDPLSRWADNLKGNWTGQLEYRDFQSDKRVSLPTWLEVQAGENPHSLKLNYTYDDGPQKVVREFSFLSIDSGSKAATITSLRDGTAQTKEVYRAAGLEAIAATGRGTFTLDGTGKENGQEVEVHITVTCGRNLYKFEKETKPAGGSFRFRDAYNMTRRDPPQASQLAP